MAYLFEFISDLFQYVYSIDFLYFMFSSVETALPFLVWIFIITPAMLSFVRSYKPKDFLGYISAALFWCICGFLVILSPFSLLLYFFYRRLYALYKKRKASKNSVQVKVVPMSPDSPSSSPSSAKLAAETVYCMESANGMTVRVPESKLEAWQAEQDRIKNDPAAAEFTEAEKKLRDAILHDLYGKHHSSYKWSENHD